MKGEVDGAERGKDAHRGGKQVRYNTGKASKQISAGEKAAYAASWRRGTPTYRQKKYLNFLKHVAYDNGIDIGEAVGHMQIDSIDDHTVAINKLKQALEAAGVEYNDYARPSPSAQKRAAFKAKKRKEAEETKWTYMSDKKPTRPIVKTLDENGYVRIYQWDGRHFLDCYGNPVITGRHKNKTPIAWAKLE